ncbi:hypothetical protein [Micropruina sonneratiae]|uniref:hypothetical protein n=1 Tax=Micropruina sonneratiae TaxID=2986940 RepID=UPI0022260755|nr:hypothetical protein [Micropruina sp. KQZ13P-5]MCW3159102.1 hypothetical protein [Micropruina sp. KQZ13P-5]
MGDAALVQMPGLGFSFPKIVTFNDYVETHTDITYSGFLFASVRVTVTPGQSYDLQYHVGTEVFTSTAAGQYYRLLGAALVTEQRSSYSEPAP